MEIRRARALDVVLTSDAFVLLGMLGGFCCFAALLVIALVFDPPVLAVAVWAVVAAAVEHRTAERTPDPVPAPVSPTPGSAA